jgi:transcriptional regulator GlxA family with amidase domain
MTEHMQTARITRACAMLRTTRASIVDVALRVGFFDQAHFTRVFRRVMGDTPARYRASVR